MVLVRTAAVAFAGWLMLAPAIAATLDVSGTYGNAAGCKYVATQDYGDDTMIILTADEWQTFASLCEFIQVLPVRDGSHVVTMLCASEGEITQSVEFGRIVKNDGADAFDVYNGAGDLQGKVERCK